MKFPTKSIVLAVIGFLSASARSEIIAGKNLLVNGSGESAVGTGWTLTNGGSGWAVAGGGYDAIGGRFITSYALCKRSQLIDLQAQGATSAELDAAPPIRISEAISSDANRAIADTYYIRVELRNATGGVVARWDAGTETARKTAPTSWTLESFEFRNYGPGVRFVYFEDGGVDGGYWSGHYGTFHDAATVTFLNQPVTDVTLTPASIPNVVPAGGIVGHLAAVDGDNAVHSFVLEPDVTTATVPLIAAGQSDWRYLDGGPTPPANWSENAFDDSAWASGTAPLGYDSGGADTWIVTALSYGGVATTKPFSVQLRKTFTATNVASITALAATVQVDDGCIVYLNGQELFRDGMPVGAITNTTPASRTVGGADESDFDPVIISPDKLALLREGTNVLAVSLHQDKITSSDTTFDINLTATSSAAVNNYSNGLFEISGTELRLKDGSVTLPVGDYSIRVRASDPAGNTFAKLITVSRTNTTFPAAPTDLMLSTASVSENAPTGLLVSGLTVTDADAGQAHRYEAVVGAGDEHNAMVQFYGNSVLLVSSPDFETQAAVKFRVRVTDSTGLSFTKALELAVTDDTSEDQDGDGLTEAQEDLNGNGVLDAGETDPFVADTDNDTFNDRIERQAGSDPRDPGSIPGVIEMNQIVTHATGNSWLTASSWQGGEVPQAIHLAVTNNLTFRSPPTDAPVFPGAGIRIQNGGIFRMKHTGLCDIRRIILDNATLQQGMTVAIGVGGPGARLEIPTTGIIDTAAVQLDLSASLAGSGVARFIGTGRAELLEPSAGFTGTVVVAGAVVHPANATALDGTTLLLVKSGKLRLSQTVSVGDAAFGSLMLLPGSYTVADLVNLGVSSSLLEDAGGTLTIAGTLAAADSDGDGQSDLFERIAGTNPNDGADRLQLTSVTAPTANSILLQWQAVAGVSYTVQSTADLSGTWTDLATVTPTTAVGTYNASLTAPFLEKTFFRLMLK